MSCHAVALPLDQIHASHELFELLHPLSARPPACLAFILALLPPPPLSRSFSRSTPGASKARFKPSSHMGNRSMRPYGHFHVSSRRQRVSVCVCLCEN